VASVGRGDHGPPARSRHWWFAWRKRIVAGATGGSWVPSGTWGTQLCHRC
jgi:hypothetical protein